MVMMPVFFVFVFTGTMAVFILWRWQFLYCDDGSFCTVKMAVFVLWQWHFVFCDDGSFFFYCDDGSFYTVTMAVFFFIVTMAVFVLRRCQFLYCDDGSFCTVTMAVSVLWRWQFLYWYRFVPRIDLKVCKYCWVTIVGDGTGSLVCSFIYSHWRIHGFAVNGPSFDWRF